LNKISLAGPVWLASDVHLGQHTEGTSEAFRDFLKLAASEAQALLLPGDIFDAWIGDDVAVVAPPWLAQDLMAIKACAAKIPVWLGRGNRDFLMGEALAAGLGARLLPEEVLVTVGARTFYSVTAMNIAQMMWLTSSFERWFATQPGSQVFSLAASLSV